MTTTQINITKDMTPVEAANLLARLEEGHQAAWKSTHQARRQSAEYESRFQNAAEVDGVFRDVMWETVENGMRHPGEPVQEFAERAESEAKLDSVGKVGAVTATYGLVHQADADQRQEDGRDSREGIAAHLLNDQGTPEGHAYARALSDTAAACVKGLREPDPLPELDRTPGAPHPDPFLASRGWHLNEHGIFVREPQMRVSLLPGKERRRAEMRPVIKACRCMWTGIPVRISARIGRRQRELSDRVHAADDECARDHGWDVTYTTGRFGFGARSYRDPRFDRSQESEVTWLCRKPPAKPSSAQ